MKAFGGVGSHESALVGFACEMHRLNGQGAVLECRLKDGSAFEVGHQRVEAVETVILRHFFVWEGKKKDRERDSCSGRRERGWAKKEVKKEREKRESSLRSNVLVVHFYHFIDTT